jgi:hypothetical protein
MPVFVGNVLKQVIILAIKFKQEYIQVLIAIVEMQVYGHLMDFVSNIKRLRNK